MTPRAEYQQERAPFTCLMAALFLLSGATGIVTAESTADSTATSWTLTLTGAGEETISANAFHEIKARSGITYTAPDGSVYTGVPLKLLIGMVDDADPATFNATRAAEGYSIIIRATDWHDRIFSPSDLTDTGFCVADSVNGGPLPKQDGDIKIAPLILVGEDVPPGMGIGNIMDIRLTGAAITGEAKGAVSVTVIRYDEEGGNVLNATTVDCRWMRDHLPIHGDGVTTYSFQGPTFDTADLWNPAEDKNLEKVREAPRGTAISDLCDLVGGMQDGDELRMTSTDGYVVELMYENIYTPKEKQGTAILAWETKKEGFAPEYTGAPALFFLSPDHVFGNQDMKECIDPGYWRYYWCAGTSYPSVAGLAVRNVERLEIYPRKQADWALNLSGYLTTSIPKKEFEQGLACGERAHGHAITYTDDDGHVWRGMPLYMLVGFVDDACQHDENLVDNMAYNVTLAKNDAYMVILANDDGDTVSFTSREIMRNRGYLVVNQVDNHTFGIDSGIWPLALRGEAVPKEKAIDGITTLTLVYDAASSGSAKPPDAMPAPFPWAAVLAGIALAGYALRRRS